MLLYLPQLGHPLYVPLSLPEFCPVYPCTQLGIEQVLHVHTITINEEQITPLLALLDRGSPHHPQLLVASPLL